MKLLMILNSPQVQPGDVLKHASDRAIVAVDGGVSHVLGAGLAPDWALGDWDSVSPEELQRVKGQGARLISFPREKDYTDMELALALVRRLKCRDLSVLGLTGGLRLDHQVTNFQLLAREAAQGIYVSAPGPGQSYFFSRRSLVLKRAQGNMFSLLAFNRTAAVEIIGARYQGQIQLQPGTGYGLGNEIVKPGVLIHVQRGSVAVAQWGE